MKNHRFLTTFFYFLLLQGITGCLHKESSNRQHSQHEAKGVSVAATFMKTEKHSSASANLRSVKQEEGDVYLQFMIRLEKPGFTADSKTVNYLDFEMQNDFMLVVGTSDTVLPQLVHRVATGKKDQFEYIVVFNQGPVIRSQNEDVVIVYDDKIFGLGKEIFAFKKRDIL